jgi:protein-S-isoprenylcysteine O-methyltransferase Ste14
MQSRYIWAITALQLLAGGVLLCGLFLWPGPWNAQRYIGTALVVAGLSGIAVARYQLGKSFSIKPEAHLLVTSGVYSKIRNPIYVFGTVMISGLAIILQRPTLWIFVGVAIVGQTVRARREARVLEAAFGDAYREYRRKTWF